MTSITGLRLRELRKYKKLSQQEVADFIGVSRPTYGRWEVGNNEPDHEALSQLADYFEVSTDYLLGREEDSLELDKANQIPLLGTIACGLPILAEENIEEYIAISKHVKADFALTCKGDSMQGAGINDGSIVFIRQQNQVDNGQIAAVLIDNSATLKRVYYYPEKNRLVLRASNLKYEDMIYTGEELNEVTILGKAVYYLAEVIHE